MSKDYNDLFQEHLEMKLRGGGSPQMMASIVKIYENEDGDLREYAFREWVEGEEFSCGRCGGHFRASADVANEYSAVLCQSCAKFCK